jgi:hypothetical protein
VQEAAQRLFSEPWSPDDPEEFVTWLNAIRDRVAQHPNPPEETPDEH